MGNVQCIGSGTALTGAEMEVGSDFMNGLDGFMWDIQGYAALAHSTADTRG